MSNRSKVLIVDDEKIICDLLMTFLRHKGYETRAVYSGEDALGALETERFDVVITDLQMFGVSGLDVIRHVQKTSPETILFMLTGSACQKDREKAMECGADEFFRKPVAFTEMLDRLPPPLTKST